LGIYLKKYGWILNLFLVFLASLFLAKIASAVIASKLRIQKNLDIASVATIAMVDRKKAAFDDFKVIMDRNMFDSRDIEVEAPISPGPTEVNLEGPAVKTTLPIKLVSTFVVGLGTDSRSSATISGGSGGGAASDTYTVGDEKQFSPGVKITKILPDRVEFINGPRLEYAEIEQFGAALSTNKPMSALDGPVPPGGAAGGEGVKQLEQGKFVVDKVELETALGNVDQLFTQIRAVPQFKDGKAAGLKLLSIKGGSIFAKLGLKRNDVLERINGQEVDMKRGMEIFGQLKDSNRISIDLMRDGKKTTLDYDIQ